jgi:hypothetical protein
VSVESSTSSSTSTSDASAAPPTAPKPSARRRRLPGCIAGPFGCLGFGLGALVALVLLAPLMLRGYARGWTERAFAQRYQGSLAIGDLELSWWSPVEATRVELRDPAGATVLSGSLRAPTLFALARGAFSGQFGRSELVVQGDVSADDAGRTNLERALAPRPEWEARQSKTERPPHEPGPDLGAYGLELDLHVPRLTWSDARTRALGTVCALRELRAHVQAQAGGAFVASARGAIDGERPGSLRLDAQLPRGLASTEDPSAQVQLELEIEGLATGLADALAAQRGLLVEALGETLDLDLRVAGPLHGAEPARVELDLGTPRANARLRARLSRAALHMAEGEELHLSLAARPALLQRVLPARAAELGLAADFAGGSQNLELALRELELALPASSLAPEQRLAALLASARAQLEVRAGDWKLGQDALKAVTCTLQLEPQGANARLAAGLAEGPAVLELELGPPAGWAQLARPADGAATERELALPRAQLSLAGVPAAVADLVRAKLPPGAQLELSGALLVRALELLGGAPEQTVLQRAARASGRFELELGGLRYTDEALRAQGVALELHALRANGEQAAAAAPRASVRAQLPARAGAPGAGAAAPAGSAPSAPGLELELQARAPLGTTGDELPPADVQLALRGLDARIADALARQNGRLLALVGPELALQLDGRGLTRTAGEFELELDAPLMDAKFAGRLVDGRVESRDDAPGDLAFALTPFSSEHLVGSLLPLAVGLRPQKPEQRALLQLSGYSLPLDGDLSRLDARVRLDLGVVGLDLLPALAPFLGSALATKATQLGPYELAIEDGRIGYQKLPLRLGSAQCLLDGSFDLARRELALELGVPLAALGKGAGALVEQSRGLLDPGLVVPISVQGPLLSPRVALGSGVLEKALQGAAKQAVLGGLLESLGGSKSDAKKDKQPPAPAPEPALPPK